MSSGRFAKGQSGNPGGRPRKARETEAPSAFNVVFDQTIAVREGARTRELSAEEALQLRTYQEALKGSRVAQRTIMKMIAKREAWKAKHAPKPSKNLEVKLEKVDASGDAIAAMLSLGMATPDEAGTLGEGYRLEAWAVDAALRRRTTKTLDILERGNIRNCVRDWTSLDLSSFRDADER